MVIRPKLNWFAMLFVWKGSVLPAILPRLCAIFAISLVAVLGHLWYSRHGVTLNATPFSLIGIALAIFLGFRNNAAYERFTDGRRIWGALLNTSRSLARQAQTLPLAPTSGPAAFSSSSPSTSAPGKTAARIFTGRLIAFTHALRHQLRHSDSSPDLDRLLSATDAARVHEAAYKPAVLLLMMGEWIAEQRAHGQLSDMLAAAMEHNLNLLSDVLGGCERIEQTPIPFAYSVLLHRTTYFYCTLLPFGLTDSIGWLTPVIAVFVAYTFMALDAIAEELEYPFGTEPNDLALDAMSRTIERTAREIACWEPLPEAGKPNADYIVE